MEKNIIARFLTLLENTEGVSIGNYALTAWSFINILQTVVIFFMFSISMVFDETRKIQFFIAMRIVGSLIFLMDMILSFINQRFESGKELKNLKEIGEFYLKNGFIIDLISVFVFPIDLFIESNISVVLTFVALMKLWNNINVLEKFEYIFINSNGKEQYYGLIKVFLTNFAIGHFLSILLNLMAHIDNSDNWYTKVNITNA